MRDFRKLEIWKRSFELVKRTYKLLEDFPNDENFGLSSQIKRSLISIPSNIAEGCGRSTDKELARFIDIAMGSSFELETQLLLGRELGFISENKLEPLLDELNQIQKMSNKFSQTLRIKANV